MVALNDAQLGNIRGGFDVSPNLTVNFGFQQVTSVNHDIVRNVVVPNVTISPLSTGTRFSSADALGSFAKRSPSRANGVTGNAAAVPAVVANGGSPARPVSQNVGNNIVASSQGTTTVLAQLGGGGLATIIGNTADNALVQNMTTINLAVSGLGSLLAQGRSNAALTNALSLGYARFR